MPFLSKKFDEYPKKRSSPDVIRISSPYSQRTLNMLNRIYEANKNHLKNQFKVKPTTIEEWQIWWKRNKNNPEYKLNFQED